MVSGTIINGTLRYLPYLQSSDIPNCQINLCHRGTYKLRAPSFLKKYIAHLLLV